MCQRVRTILRVVPGSDVTRRQTEKAKDLYMKLGRDTATLSITGYLLARVANPWAVLASLLLYHILAVQSARLI